MKEGSGSPTPEVQWANAAVIVTVAESAEQRRWVASRAVRFARDLARRQSRVVLADLRADRPSLSDALRTSPARGIVDVLFRGAAFSSAATRPEDEQFYFLPVGTAPPPPAVLYRHPQWARIAERFRDAGAYLLLCVTAQDWLDSGPIPGFEVSVILNARGTEISLGSEGHRPTELIAPLEVREHPVQMPEGIPASPSLEPATPFETAGKGSGAATPTSKREPEQPPAVGDRTEAPPARSPAAAEPPGTEGVRTSELGGSRRGRSKIYTPRHRRASRAPALAGLGLAAVLAVAGWWIVGRTSGNESLDTVEAAADTAVPTASESATTEESMATAAATPEGGSAGSEPSLARGEPLPYSVLIASYSSFEDAVARQRRWDRTGSPFYVAPTVVKGVVYYRVFAGLLADREGAMSLMRSLVEEGIKDTVRDWDIRPTRLAFSFGEFSNVQEARDTIRRLLERGVPAYAVPTAIRGSPGDTVYLVYAGGYASPADARPLQGQIESENLGTRLVERVGGIRQ